MAALAPPLAERLFEARHLLLASSEVGEIVDVCSKALRPHALLVHQRAPRLAACLHHVPIGPFSVNRLRYGCRVSVTPAVPEEDNFLITLPLEGKARFHYGTESTDVEPGRGAIVGPYEAFHFDIDAAFDQIILRFNRRRVEQVCADLVCSEKALPIHFGLPLAGAPRLWDSLLDSTAGLAAVGDELKSGRWFEHVEEMMIEALLLSQPNSFDTVIYKALRPAPSAQVRRAMEYMREHVGEPIRMGAVARHCCISLRGLQMGFLRDLGTSPSRWLREMRLECAYQDLLLASPGSMTVTDIALQRGFFHLGEFGACFKARYGLKPSEVLAGRRP